MTLYSSVFPGERCPKFACAVKSPVLVSLQIHLPKFRIYWENEAISCSRNLQSHSFARQSSLGKAVFEGNQRSSSDLPSSLSCFSCLSPVRGQPASSCTWSGAMWQRGLGAVTSLSLLHHLDSSFSPTQLIVSPSPNLLPLSPLRALDKATTAATWRTRWSPR